MKTLTCLLLSGQFFGQFKVLGQENKHVSVLLSQPHASMTADERWCAEHSFWSAAWGWNARVLSGKMCKSWQGGWMVLPPGERVRSTYLFNLFVQQEFTWTDVEWPTLPSAPPASSVFSFFCPSLTFLLLLLCYLDLLWNFITFLQQYCLHIFFIGNESVLKSRVKECCCVEESVQQSAFISCCEVCSYFVFHIMSMNTLSILHHQTGKYFPFQGQHKRQCGVLLYTQCICEAA